MKTTKTKSGDRKQIAAFRKAAHELGCEDNEERFQQALRTVAKGNPQLARKRQKRHINSDK